MHSTTLPQSRITLFLTLATFFFQATPSLAAFTRLRRSLLFQAATPNTVREVQVNFLRDSVAVSNLPSVFGKYDEATLHREAVHPQSIWLAVDPYIRSLLETPDRLNWLVADIHTEQPKDTITLNLGFSCVDRGRAQGHAALLWASPGFEPITNSTDSYGGLRFSVDVVAGGAHQDVDSDIVRKCWARQRNHSSPSGWDDEATAQQADSRASSAIFQTEHDGDHKGNPLRLKTPQKVSIPLDDPAFFSQLYNLRVADSSKKVRYAPGSNIPVVESLPFDTGFRMLAPITNSANENPRVRIPAVANFALRRHIGARLRAAQSGALEPVTNAPILVLSVLSTGLALIVAVWLVFKLAADNAAERARDLQRRGVFATVRGDFGSDRPQKMAVVLHLIAVAILSAPLALAIVNGEADPRPLSEVTSGVGVMYSSSHANLSLDTDNLVAGAVFQVTAFITVRTLSDSLFLPFGLSLALVVALAAVVALFEARRISEAMPARACRRDWPSFWKSVGTLKLWIKSLSVDEPSYFKVLVEFRDDVEWAPSTMEMFLLTAPEFRDMANDADAARRNEKWFRNDRLRRLGGNAVHQVFVEDGDFFYRMTGIVTLDNGIRLRAMLARSRWFSSVLPREWFFITSGESSAGGSGGYNETRCRTIDFCRTHGEMLPDEYLVIARIGLLPYLRHVKRVYVTRMARGRGALCDRDGVGMWVLRTRGLDEVGTSLLGRRGTQLRANTPVEYVHVEMMRDGDDMPELLRNPFFASGAQMSMDGVYRVGKNAVPHGDGVQVYVQHVTELDDCSSAS